MRALLDARTKVRLAIDALVLGRRKACRGLLDDALVELSAAIAREGELRRENERLERQLRAKDRAGAELDPTVTKTSAQLSTLLNKGV